MKKVKESVLERLTEVFESIKCVMEARIVIELSSTEIPTIEYDIKEAIVGQGGVDD